jgi:hypothetical protein
MMTFDDVRPAINNSVLTLYRIFAVVSLYAVLAGVLVFASVAGFYAVSDSWVAPIILNQTDKDTLDLNGKLLNANNTANTFKLDIAKLQQTGAEARNHKAALESLRPAIDAAITREKRYNQESGPVLVNLDQQKNSDIVRTQQMLNEMAKVNVMIDKELSAGLIDKTDAIQAKMVYVKSVGDLTDSRIATTLLKDNIQDKTVSTTRYLETLNKKAELESEIATLGITISTAEKQIATEQAELDQFNGALEAAKTTPYWVAMQGGNVNVALVPYDNRSVVALGAPVYDCHLSFVFCRQVGTVKTTFAGEQHGTHPIFRTDLRGFLAELQLSDAESAKSRTLFVGSKPLFF